MATAIWIVSSLLLLAGLFGIWRQHFPFSRWQPVPAWIVEQHVDREQDIIENVGGALGGAVKALKGKIESDGVTDVRFLVQNQRVVTYKYDVAGQSYTSSNVFLSWEDSSIDLVERFPPDRVTTAYVDPMDPSRSYLIAYPLFRSYGMALTALLGFSVAFLSIGQAEFDPVAPKSWLPYVLVWWSLGLAAVGHYAWLRGPFSVGGAITSLLYFTAASLPYLIPWAGEHAVPWINTRVAPLVAESLSANMVSYVGAGVFATFFIGMIIVLPLWFAGSKARMAERFESVYVPVDVEISLSELRKNKSFSGTKDSVGHWYYWPEIQFDYTVQGQHFNTGVYSPSHTIGQTGEPSDEMREIIANYPVGSTHTARYDPDEPHLAFLFVEKSAGMSRTVKLVMLALGLGALFLIVLTIAISSRA